ncbi:hypothetical protein K439DRAFT_1400067, partial [Ramaria rubella]
MSSKVSFTIRPPTSSRSSVQTTNFPREYTRRSTSFTPHAADSSDEDEQDGAIEAVTGFDQSGAQRCVELLHTKPEPDGPLVIPALANRDWRAVARIRKQIFIPDGSATSRGKDGSQGGLGTRDSINSGPQVAGLVRRKQQESAAVSEGIVNVESQEVSLEEVLETAEENEDELARRALLATATGDEDGNGFIIDAIPVTSNNYAPLDEIDAYKQDVVTRPDSATLADYERVPVSQFGAALLRGMGWKEGTAASRTRRGLVEPWLPTSRPALLGIGAKERPAEDIPTTGKGGFTSKRPEKRYVPLVKVQREDSVLPPPSRSRSRSPGRSRTVSRVPSSKSASPYPGDEDKGRRRHYIDDDNHSRYSKSGREQRDRDVNRESDSGRHKKRDDKKRSDRERNDRERGERRRDSLGRERERDDLGRKDYKERFSHEKERY